MGLSTSPSGGIPFDYLDTDATMAANSDSKIATQKAVKTALATKPTAFLLVSSNAWTANDALVPTTQSVADYIDTKAKVKVIGIENTDSSTSSTDGTFDGLQIDDLSNLFSGLAAEVIIEEESVAIIGSATATRRVKKNITTDLNVYKIFDSGALTVSAGGILLIKTSIFAYADADPASIRCVVSVTTSISTVPIVTVTDITAAVVLSDLFIDTQGAAAGVGAASGDIAAKTKLLTFFPAVGA